MPEIKPTKPENIPAIRTLEIPDAYWICPYTYEQHIAWMEAEDSAHFSLFIEEKEEPVGFFLIRGLKNDHLSLELKRIVIGEKGKGLGRFCIKWIKKYCFEELKFHRLWLDVFTDNERAQHLYVTEGFTKEGELREIIKNGDQYRSLYLFSILEGEYIK